MALVLMYKQSGQTHTEANPGQVQGYGAVTEIVAWQAIIKRSHPNFSEFLVCSNINKESRKAFLG